MKIHDSQILPVYPSVCLFGWFLRIFTISIKSGLTLGITAAMSDAMANFLHKNWFSYFYQKKIIHFACFFLFFNPASPHVQVIVGASAASLTSAQNKICLVQGPPGI